MPAALDAILPLLKTPPKARVGVVGLGYVGLPLVRDLHAAGFAVTGFDIDQSKIDRLRSGQGYLMHLGLPLFQALAASDRFLPTIDPTDLATCDCVCVCVPTPLDEHQNPDLCYVLDSMSMLARVLTTRRAAGNGPMLVSLESTTYPGTTDEIRERCFEPMGLKHDEDYLLCFAPERENPGGAHATRDIPRVVGGLTDNATSAGCALYAHIASRVVPVSSASVAEASKLLENIYRSVNIALVNELKPVFLSMGIDIWEVLDAAATKPFGFQRFNPGPGLGGHCIPIDPFYLTWKAKEFGHATRFIELAGEINSTMPRFVVERIAHALNDDAKPLKGSRVLLLGIAYKPDVDDVRETPASEVLRLLRERGSVVSYHDPHVPAFPSLRRLGEAQARDLASVPLSTETLAENDCVVVITDHRAIDWTLVGQHARLIVDTRNAMARVQGVKARVVKA